MPLLPTFIVHVRTVWTVYDCHILTIFECVGTLNRYAAMSVQPALSPLAGSTSDFSLRREGEKWYFIIIPILLIVSGLFLVLRMYTKIFVVHHVNLADCEYEVL